MMHTYSRALLMHKTAMFPVKVRMVKDNSNPERTNHVKLTGNWRMFASLCGFKMPKMLRLKLVNTNVEVVEGEEIRIAVFEVC